LRVLSGAVPLKIRCRWVIDGALHREEAVVNAEDAVWLEMFASKLVMIQRMDRLAPPSTQAKKKDQARVMCAA